MIELTSESPVRNQLSRNNFSNDSLANICEDDEISENSVHNFFYDYRIKYIFSIIAHISIQISYLSLLEPILYFNYIVGVEKELIYDQLSTITDYDIIFQDSNEVRNEPFYPLLIQFIDYENIYIDGFYNQLQDSAQDEIDRRDKLRDKLQNTAFSFTIGSWIIMIVYLSVFKYLYPKKKITKYLVNHIIFIICIGLYELWFFRNIIINYIPWSKDEIELYLFNCFWDSAVNHYPELQIMENNVTITCDN